MRASILWHASFDSVLPPACARWRWPAVAIARAGAHTSLRVVFDAARIVNPAMRAKAINEAARIWAQYDVSLVTEEDGRCAAVTPAAVTVTIDLGRDSGTQPTRASARFSSRPTARQHPPSR